MKTYLKRHSLIIGLVLMFLYTWTIDLSNSGVLQFKVLFVVALTVGWGFILISHSGQSVYILFLILRLVLGLV